MAWMKEYCDLHTHSLFSDGTYTPAALIDEAERIGLAAIALTDHNTLDGIPSFLQAAAGRPLRAIAGVEISTDYGDTELHIVGLFLRQEHFERINALLAGLVQNKKESNKELVQRLCAAGYRVSLEELTRMTPNGLFNRAHVASLLVRGGYVSSISEAFDTLLSEKSEFYVAPRRLPVFEVIAFLKSIGAVAVLAHPFLNLDEAALRVFLPLAASCGLDAMETRYSTYDAATTALATSMAKEFGLKESGGSDFHGARKPDISLGIGRGSLAVPAAWAALLAEGVAP